MEDSLETEMVLNLETHQFPYPVLYHTETLSCLIEVFQLHAASEDYAAIQVPLPSVEEALTHRQVRQGK